MKNTVVLRKVILICFSCIRFQVDAQDYPQYRIPCDSVVYHIQLFNIKRDTVKYSNELGLNNILQFVNEVFKETCISFDFCHVDSVHDYNYFALNDESNTKEDIDLNNMYRYPYTINLFWTGDYSYTTFNGICKFNVDKPAIYLTSLSGLGLARELCQYFGLATTPSAPGSMEWVDGSNGPYAADSVWDTPAEAYPLIGGITGVHIDSIELPPFPYDPYFYHHPAKDAKGNYYNPMIRNLMSDYYTKPKHPRLTREQYQFIIRNERRCRERRWK